MSIATCILSSQQRQTHLFVCELIRPEINGSIRKGTSNQSYRIELGRVLCLHRNLHFFHNFINNGLKKRECHLSKMCAEA